MQRRTRRWRYGWIGLGVLAAVAALTFFFVLPQADGSKARRDRSMLERLSTTTVRRGDLWGSVSAGGLVGSSNQTDIECELQSLSAGVRGTRMMTNGSSTILSVVPAGTMVKKDQVLCELDSAAYVEMVRQQEMTVERAKADHLQARLDHEVAELAMQQYRNGLLRETQQSLDGRIALVKSDLERTSDRLDWSRRMLNKGYVSLSQVSSDELALQRLTFNLEQSQLASQIFQKYEVPGTLRQLKNHVDSTKTNLEHQTQRLERHTDRLDLFKRQVEHCTIRAPHDGFLIYNNDPRRNIIIEPGLEVRQKQILFFLPDLADMEVQALIHESIVQKVQEGMRTKVKIESLPHDTLEGHVTSVAALPTRNWFSEVTYYVGQVKLDHIPRGLLPGMTAEVQITTTHRPDVLTIPVQAMTVENGLEVCYVTSDHGLERREVKLGQSSQDRLEVTEGLNEGEQVVLDPSTIDSEVIAELASTPPAEVHEESLPTTELAGEFSETATH